MAVQHRPVELHPPSAPIQRFNGFPARPPNFREFYAQTYLSNRFRPGWGVARTNSSLESLWTTGHHPQMYRQLKAGRRVCRRELLEASAQPTAFLSDERERLPLLLSGALAGGDANAAAVRVCGLNRTA